MPQNWTPKSNAAKAVYAAGFQYDPDQDIIFSRMDAWQRKFGYAYVYDLTAPIAISAIIDCEPFFFSYAKKNWMIELWKGQYGFETGCEIGVYVSKQPLLDPILGSRPHDPANDKFFDCASDGERLKMSYTLYHKGAPLLKRGPEVHWWLTGFKWGVLSNPEELTMDLSITFPDLEMRKAFVAALQKANYQNISINAESVSFKFDKPASYQPRLDPEYDSSVKQARKNNSLIIEQYKKLGLSSNDPNTIPDDIGNDFAAYFNRYEPKHFTERIAEVLKAQGFAVQQVTKALEAVFKRKSSLLEKIKSGLRKLFKKRTG